MENLKKKRLGYGYCNARGEQCIVVEYKNNKHVVVRNVTRGTTHKCRWLDLRNPKCVTVYDATASRKRFESEIDEAVVNEGLSSSIVAISVGVVLFVVLWWLI